MKRDAVLSGLVGAALGTFTALGIWLLYPPDRGRSWPIPVLGVGSLLAVTVLYAVAARRLRVRSGDFLVLGYILAVLLGSVLVMTEQAVALWRSLLPSNLGV